MILQMLTERTGGHGLIPDATNVSVLIDVHLHDLAEARGDKLACRNRRNHLGRLRVVDVRLRPSVQSQPAGACLQALSKVGRMGGFVRARAHLYANTVWAVLINKLLQLLEVGAAELGLLDLNTHEPLRP